MRLMIAAAATSVAALTMSANANIIGAFWHFNDTTNLGTSLHQIDPLGTVGSETTYASDMGVMNAHISAWGGGVTDGTLSGTNGVASGGTTNNFGSFVGTSDGDQGFGSGGSLSIIGTVNNNNYFTIVFDSAESNLILSYWTRGTGTGYDTHTFHYSTDGGQTINLFTSVAANQSTSWQERVVDFGSIFGSSSGAGMNVIYVEVSGASGTSGNSRFDNVMLTIPSPGALALLGVAGLFGVRRRRSV